MTEKIRKIGMRVWKDCQTYGVAAVLVLGYLFLTKLIFHAFCPMVIVMGLPCPGCGMTRAAGLLLTGRWRQAVTMNPMVVPVAAAFLYFAVNRYGLGRKAKGMKGIIVAIAVAMILSYGYRMYLYFPDRVPYVYTEGNMLENIIGKDFINMLYERISL